jgi:hypothetical protein
MEPGNKFGNSIELLHIFLQVGLNFKVWSKSYDPFELIWLLYAYRKRHQPSK